MCRPKLFHLKAFIVAPTQFDCYPLSNLRDEMQIGHNSLSVMSSFRAIYGMRPVFFFSCNVTCKNIIFNSATMKGEVPLLNLSTAL